MAATNRPKRVVVVDADNPMVEVHGEFFWREDHDVLLAEARQAGYQDGYRTGWADAGRQQPPTFVVRRAPSVLRRVKTAILLLVALVFCLIIIATVAEQLLLQF